MSRCKSPNIDERWNPDCKMHLGSHVIMLIISSIVTKALVYQNVHGLYPSHTFPSPVLVNLGVNFGTLEQFIADRIVPRFGKNAQK